MAIILTSLFLSLPFSISTPHPPPHTALLLVNTKNALNIDVQFTRFLASSSLQISLPGVKKLPLARTWPHQIGSDWKIGPIKAISFRDAGQHFWEACSGCLQRLWGSALLPCLRQNPKCLTTRHTILGHCGGSRPPVRAPNPVCAPTPIPSRGQTGSTPGQMWGGIWPSVQSTSAAEKGGGIPSWSPWTMCDLSLGSPAWGKAMPTGSPSSSCYFWRWSPCSRGCIQTPLMVSPSVAQDSLKNPAQGWVLQSSSRWNCLLKCLRERSLPTWPYTGNGDGGNTHTLIFLRWRINGGCLESSGLCDFGLAHVCVCNWAGTWGRPRDIRRSITRSIIQWFCLLKERP